MSRPGVRALTMIAVAFSLATTGAQGPASPAALRSIVADFTAPGTVTGVRDDPSRPDQIAAMRARLRGRATAAAYVSGSVIVKFRPGTAPTAQRTMLALVNGAAQPALSYASFDLVTIDPSADPEVAARRLAAQPDVEYAQARYRAHALYTPNDPLYSRQWNYPAIDMERAWDINPGASTAITVAVLDSGVAYRNEILRFDTRGPIAQELFPGVNTIDVPFAAAPDLGGSDRFVAPHDFIWNDNDPVDTDGHGTHVTGTIGQLTNNNLGVAGMAFNVKIMPVKVIDTDWDFVFLGDFFGTDDTVARGIRYAVDNGAKVINMSIGRDGPSAPVIRDALQYAVSHGTFVAIAAGNDFLDGNPIERYAEWGPGIDGVVTVGAYARNGTRARYSSTRNVEVVAPGGDAVRDGVPGAILQQTVNPDFAFPDSGLPRFDVFSYEYYQGTSMAAPHVTGFAALLMQQGITSPAAIEAAMKKYATDIGPTGRDDEYGYGLINPRAALRGMGLAK